MVDVLADVRDRRLERPDGRVVAWSEWGPGDGLPLLRVPGTPGSRFGLRADRSVWADLGLRAITTERPGYGASTRLPGRRFAEPADDLAAILDHLGLDRVHVIGGSGSAPHQLAFAARHPDRVRAMTILVGAAPATDEEYAQLVGVNAEAHRLLQAGDLDGFRALLTRLREAIMADPLAAFRDIMDKAPDADREVMKEPGWQASIVVAAREALRPGIDGWADEGIAIETAWDDVDVEAVTTSVTWWHAPADANAALSAARRLVDRLPNARLVLFDEHEGHMAAHHREREILEELFARG
jgi:pimeloyl-ACP methyl ester carboxylesterase